MRENPLIFHKKGLSGCIQVSYYTVEYRERYRGHRSLYPASLPSGLRASLRLVREEIGLYRRHRKGIRKASTHTGQTNLKLNIGCGPNLKVGWLNIDLFNAQADLALDMREAIPFRDNSVAIGWLNIFSNILIIPDRRCGFSKSATEFFGGQPPQRGGTRYPVAI